MHRYTDVDHVPAACAACNDDPFTRPDYRGKRNSRPIGRVFHKRRPRVARVDWSALEAGE